MNSDGNVFKGLNKNLKTICKFCWNVEKICKIACTFHAPVISFFVTLRTFHYVYTGVCRERERESYLQRLVVAQGCKKGTL